MLQIPRLNPARTYDDALDCVARMKARDDERIVPAARTTLYAHGARTPIVALLLHGFTNNPAQYRELAPRLHAFGVNVLVPRLPLHGDRDRMTHRLQSLTAEMLVGACAEAIDAARGLGERLCVAGISSSGLLCAYFAQQRADIARAVPIAPVFAMLQLPQAASTIVWRLALAVPNAFLWWDPVRKEEMRPLTAYPRFPTRALAQTMRIGDAAVRLSKRRPPAARSIVAVINRHDPAVNNAVTRRWAQQVKAQLVEFDDLPRVHDIVDPDNPHARTAEIYPTLIDLILSTP